jgi:hypothetical protein
MIDDARNHEHEDNRSIPGFSRSEESIQLRGTSSSLIFNLKKKWNNFTNK